MPRRLFTLTKRTRAWPSWVRCLATTGLVLAASGVRGGLLGVDPGYPYLTAFPAVIIASLLFDRGNGVLAVFLSILLGLCLFVAPVGRPDVPSPADALAAGLFGLTGLFIAALVEDLHAAVVELSEANRQLAATEAKQEVLLREAAHRWHNDLQRLLSTLRLQAQASPDERVRAALGDAAARVNALARVDRRFRPSHSGGVLVDTHELVSGLVEDLRHGGGAELRRIGFEVAAEAHDLPREQATPLGLIVTELVGNALKYAFPEARAGTIMVGFRRDDDRFLLTVADDGVGFDPAAAPRGTGLGRVLVQGFAAQLGGQVAVRSGAGHAGTVWTVGFPAGARLGKSAGASPRPLLVGSSTTA
jgi:two-component sensor histidine kinase